MKKLLFMGALLIVGATAFGAVATEFSGGNESGSGTIKVTGASANANLRLTARGNVVDSTNTPVLVITPTVNAGADGESLTFDFSGVVKNRPQTLQGKFTAEIFYKDQPMAFGTAVVDTTLSLADGVTEPSPSDDFAITGIKLNDTSKGTEIGTLSYTLTGTQTNNFVYTGMINATVNASDVGSFNDKSAVVTVSVQELSYTKQQ